MSLSVFVPAPTTRTVKAKEHHLTVSKQGKAMLTGEGKKLLAVEDGDGVVQSQEGKEKFIAKRPIGVIGGNDIKAVRQGALTFGGKGLLQIYEPGQYKLVDARPESIAVEGSTNVNITWFRLQKVEKAQTEEAAQ